MVMKRDEFNDIHISNENGSTEYTFTQKTEYSSYEDNPNKRKSSINSTDTNNDDPAAIKAKTSDTKVKTDIITKTRSTTATSAGTVASSVAVAASTVTIVTISTLVGIKIVNESKASAVLSFLHMEDSALVYGLTLKDVKENDDPFFIKISSSIYSDSRELFMGENEGRFEGLIRDEVYTISVLQTSLGGKKILEESFKFSPELPPQESILHSVSINPEANFLEDWFEVTLSYEDPTNSLSDFTLVLHETDGLDKEYNLEKTLEPQKVSFASGALSPEKYYTYSLNYLDKGLSKTFTGEEFQFVDIAPAVPQLSNVEWNWEVYYPTGETHLRLEYLDESNELSDFVLSLGRLDDGEYTLSIPLDKTNESQMVSLLDLDVADPDEVFMAKITYHYKGEEITYDLGSGKFINTAISEFNELVVDDVMDYRNRTFNVTLDYVDENDYFYNFRFALYSPASGQYDVNIEKTTDVQTLSFPEEIGLDPAGTELDYILTYSDVREVDDIIISGPITFTDPSYSPVDGVINNLSFENKINFATGEFSLALDYTDDDDTLSNFVFTLSNEDDDSTAFSLQKSQDLQTFRFRPFVVNEWFERSFKYTLTYELNGLTQTYVESDFFTFTNNGIDEFHDVVSPYYLSEGNFYLKLDCLNQQGGYSSPNVVISDSSGELVNTYLGQSGENFGEWNYIYAPSLTSGHTYTLQVYMYLEGASASPAPQLMIEKEIEFQDGSTIPSIDGIRLNSLDFNHDVPSIGVTPYFTTTSGLSDFKLIFRFSSEDIVEIPYDLANFPSLGNYMDINLSDALDSNGLQELEDKLNNGPVDIGFSYVDADSNPHSSFDYEGVFFTVS